MEKENQNEKVFDKFFIIQSNKTNKEDKLKSFSAYINDSSLSRDTSNVEVKPALKVLDLNLYFKQPPVQPNTVFLF